MASQASDAYRPGSLAAEIERGGGSRLVVDSRGAGLVVLSPDGTRTARSATVPSLSDVSRRRAIAWWAACAASLTVIALVWWPSGKAAPEAATQQPTSTPARSVASDPIAAPPREEARPPRISNKPQAEAPRSMPTVETQHSEPRAAPSEHPVIAPPPPPPSAAQPQSAPVDLVPVH
jgi:hypothetical protein